MLFKFKIGFSVLLLLALSACVSPRYQTAYRYDPPSDTAGRACLAQCEPKLASCQTQCADKHQACVKNLEPQIEARFEQSMQLYQRDLQYYQYALLCLCGRKELYLIFALTCCSKSMPL